MSCTSVALQTGTVLAELSMLDADQHLIQLEWDYHTKGPDHPERTIRQEQQLCVSLRWRTGKPSSFGSCSAGDFSNCSISNNETPFEVTHPLP